MGTFDFSTGGQKIIYRLVEAYGFKNRQALSDYLGITKSTLFTRFHRDTFPADWVIQCALETNVTLDWLVTGNEPKYNEIPTDLLFVKSSIIENGNLTESNLIKFDKAFLPENMLSPKVIINYPIKYIVDEQFNDVSDGEWLVRIENNVSIKHLERIPVKRLRISGTDLKLPFDCGIDEIEILAKVRGIFTQQ